MQLKTFIITTIAILGAVILRTEGTPRAIAEDPEFQKAWKEYQSQTPSARMNKMPLAHFPKAKVIAPGQKTNKIHLSHFNDQIPTQTPASICQSIQQRVTYAPDRAEHWQSFEETWSRRSGDCEDFSIAIQTACESRGIKSEVYVLSGTGTSQAHAVVIGEWNGKYWISSNGSYQEAETLSNAYEKAADQMKRDNQSVKIHRVTDTNKRLGTLVKHITQS